jgi:hypothetical protein
MAITIVGVTTTSITVQNVKGGFVSVFCGITSNNTTIATDITYDGSSILTIGSLQPSTLYFFRINFSSYSTGEFSQSTDAAPAVPCFFGNAPVLTPTGYCRMDSLRTGDRVMTPAGAEATIERVKVTRCAASPATNPYVIPKGRFGAERRVLISPNHKVVTQAGLVEARHLGLEQETREGELTYYNLELEGQAHMVVGGVAVESLTPVRRYVITMAEFKELIQQQYGGLNASVLANIQRSCKILSDGRIEVPAMEKTSLRQNA